MNNNIGRCELCGVVDHHLVNAECPQCREKLKTNINNYDDVPLGVEAGQVPQLNKKTEKQTCEA